MEGFLRPPNATIAIDWLYRVQQLSRNKLERLRRIAGCRFAMDVNPRQLISFKK